MKHSNTNKDIDRGMSSRRKFITKAAAGGVVAALASKTVWAGGSGSATGCTVSGNLSGNLSQARDCTTANVKGASPYIWKKVLYGYISQPTQYSVRNFQWKEVFGDSRPPFSCPGKNDKSIRNFLRTDRSYYNETNEALVVAYLNASSGLYPLPQGTTESGARAYAQGLYYDIFYDVFSESKVVDAVRATYE